MTATLEVRGLSKHFGGIRAVADFGVTLVAGEVCGLIGPNGSGKSTTMHLISGYLPADAGTIVLNEKVVDRLPVQRRTALGLGRTFQAPNLFPQLTVLENVLAGCHTIDRRGTRFLDVYLRPRSSRATSQAMAARAMETLERVGLPHRADDMAMLLPYGEQKLLGLARAVVAEPSVLLMDEPLAGLGPRESDRLLAIVHELRQSGCTILFAEHNVPAVMRICDRITVLNFGVTIAEGTPDEIQRHPEVLDAYLGREDAEAPVVQPDAAELQAGVVGREGLRGVPADSKPRETDDGE